MTDDDVSADAADVRRAATSSAAGGTRPSSPASRRLAAGAPRGLGTARALAAGLRGCVPSDRVRFARLFRHAADLYRSWSVSGARSDPCYRRRVLRRRLRLRSARRADRAAGRRRAGRRACWCSIARRARSSTHGSATSDASFAPATCSSSTTRACSRRACSATACRAAARSSVCCCRCPARGRRRRRRVRCADASGPEAEAWRAGAVRRRGRLAAWRRCSSSKFFGRRRIRLSADRRCRRRDVDALVDAIGHMPLPPYIKRPDVAGGSRALSDGLRGRSAARSRRRPPACTSRRQIVARSRRTRHRAHAAVTLHVGYGTFKPVRVERVEEHTVDPEAYEIGERGSGRDQRARAERPARDRRRHDHDPRAGGRRPTRRRPRRRRRAPCADTVHLPGLRRSR